MDLLVRLRSYQHFIREKLPSTHCLATLKVALVVLDQTKGFGLEDRPLSLRELAMRTGCSEKSVRKALQQLDEEGFLIREERTGKSSILGCIIPDFNPKVPTAKRWGVPTRQAHREPVESTPPRHDHAPPPSEGEGSYTWSEKSTCEKNITSLEPQEDPSFQDELTPLAHRICEKLEGKTRRVIRPPEVLPTLRELKADSLNRNLVIDLPGTILEAIEHGIEANLRKNGTSTIWSWQYFSAGLRDALEKATVEKKRHLVIEEIRKTRAQEEAAQERSLEDQTAVLRERWERLPEEERRGIELRVFQGLEDFIRSSVRRDRELNRRGPGIVALEQACLREIGKEIRPQSSLAWVETGFPPSLGNPPGNISGQHPREFVLSGIEGSP